MGISAPAEIDFVLSSQNNAVFFGGLSESPKFPLLAQASCDLTERPSPAESEVLEHSQPPSPEAPTPEPRSSDADKYRPYKLKSEEQGKYTVQYPPSEPPEPGNLMAELVREITGEGFDLKEAGRAMAAIRGHDVNTEKGRIAYVRAAAEVYGEERARKTCIIKFYDSTLTVIYIWPKPKT